tara:strand:- start:223 stop:531 length:309 start_codon:yes stop_codon:yes gene_type:complete
MGFRKKKKEQTTEQRIVRVFGKCVNMVRKKNKQYGDSVVDPLRIFSNSSPIEQLFVRIDDKLSRLKRGNDSMERDIDIWYDLMGYCSLVLVHLGEGESIEAD